MAATLVLASGMELQLHAAGSCEETRPDISEMTCLP